MTGYCLASKPVNRSSMQCAMKGPLRDVTRVKLASTGLGFYPAAVHSYAMRSPGKETGLRGRIDDNWLDQTRATPKDLRQALGILAAEQPLSPEQHLFMGYSIRWSLTAPSYPIKPRTSDSRTRTSSLPSRSISVVPYFS
jgi:hypothetical protein